MGGVIVTQIATVFTLLWLAACGNLDSPSGNNSAPSVSPPRNINAPAAVPTPTPAPSPPTPPVVMAVQISTIIPSVTKQRDYTMQFSGTRDGAPAPGFECKLDFFEFAPCSPPLSHNGLAEGEHLFQVRAIDALGNRSSTASRIWRIDLTPPKISISGPAGPIPFPVFYDGTSFQFTVQENGGGTVAAVTCQLNNETPTPCASPVKYNLPYYAAYTFTVRASDSAGNVAVQAQTFSYYNPSP